MVPTAHSPAHARAAVSGRMGAIWARHADETLRRVGVVEDAVVALLLGDLADEARREAVRAAHKLAGSVGTFGFAEGSRIARDLEHLLDGEEAPAHRQVPQLSELVLALRRELAAPVEAPGAAAATPPAEDRRPLLLLVDEDEQLAEGLVTQAGAAGVRAVVVAGPGAARELLAREPPDVVLLDLGAADDSESELRLLSDLSTRRPPVPVLVLTAQNAVTDRVAVARHGAVGSLDRSAPLPQVIEAVTRALAHPKGPRATVLALDDDPAVLDVLSALLAPTDLDLRTLDAPLRLFDALAETLPDLLVLDFELPHADGVELCRALRNDPRWATLPVLFLTGRTDAETVRRMFDAGADDYLTKPVVGPELVARITNRLERVRLVRRTADSDPLTGIPSRRHCLTLLEQLIRTADRSAQPVSIAVLGVDHLRQVNDRFGHGVGDAVLRRVGELLTGALRGADVAGRWAGTEFVLGMYGTAEDDGVQRVADLLEACRGETFHGPDGTPFTVTLTAGVAQYPDDGADLDALYRRADRARHRAKAAGGNRTLPAGERRSGAGVVDVVLVEDDEVLASLVLHSLETRGYVVRWLSDGQEAADALAGGLDPRVLLLDWDLPGLNGLDVLATMAGSGKLDRTQVIMLTARSTEAEVLEALRLGATEHVPKPFSVPVLMQRLHRLLSR